VPMESSQVRSLGLPFLGLPFKKKKNVQAGEAKREGRRKMSTEHLEVAERSTLNQNRKTSIVNIAGVVSAHPNRELPDGAKEF